MSYNKGDFVDETVIEFEIKGVGKFAYKPMTSGDENDWLDEYMGDDGKLYLGKFNACKVKYNLARIPYGREALKDIIGIDKEWKDLDPEQRYEFLGKLKSKILAQVVKQIGQIDRPSEKKN